MTPERTDGLDSFMNLRRSNVRGTESHKPRCECTTLCYRYRCAEESCWRACRGRRVREHRRRRAGRVRTRPLTRRWREKYCPPKGGEEGSAVAGRSLFPTSPFPPIRARFLASCSSIVPHRTLHFTAVALIFSRKNVTVAEPSLQVQP